jgi:hypothetical protein
MLYGGRDPAVTQLRGPHHLADVRERDLSLRLGLPPHEDRKRGSLPAGLHHGADRAVDKAQNGPG